MNKRSWVALLALLLAMGTIFCQKGGIFYPKPLKAVSAGLSGQETSESVPQPESSLPDNHPSQSSPSENSPSQSSPSQSSPSESSPSQSSVEEPSGTQGSIVDPTVQYTSASVYRDIDLLCDRYPELISQEVIGSSQRGKPIVCVKLGKGGTKACIVSGIHAREHITISFTMKCIEEYAEACRKGTDFCGYDMAGLLDRFTLYLVPMCNPDGTDISTAGEMPLTEVKDFDADRYKLNANGVNLNRNFPYHWEEVYTDTAYRPGDEKYPGSSAASEPETQALMKLCEENEFQWLLDMHIVGNGIYWRDKWNGEIPGDYAFASEIADQGGYQVFPMSSDPTIFGGGLENYFRQTYQKPALCIEMIPYGQAELSERYSDYNSYFEDAVNWTSSRTTFLAAMNYTVKE